jgi:hypothetical protein
MCRGLNLAEFLNTYQEWHAFVEGFNEVFCFWKPRHRLSGELLKDLQAEHHYYTTGRVAGFVALIATGLITAKITKKWIIK